MKSAYLLSNTDLLPEFVPRDKQLNPAKRHGDLGGSMGAVQCK